MIRHVYPIGDTPGRRKSSGTEQSPPRPNSSLVRSYDQDLGRYEMAIASYPEADRIDAASRKLAISTDTIIEFEGFLGELMRDARFVFNALMLNRNIDMSARAILSFDEGFRGNIPDHGKRIPNLATTQLFRTINALNNFAIMASQDDIVYRSARGSRPDTAYWLAPDVAIVDKRTQQK